MIPKDLLLFGSSRYAPSRRTLRAGPLSVVLQDGVLRYVKLDDVEIVRRVYMALRDQNWNTIATAYSNWKHDVRKDSFQISFDGENKQGEIDYRWKGSITGDHNGKITYSMSGVTLSDFKKRIIGLCALLPIKECAGKSATVIQGNDTRKSATFPLYISSEQPLHGFDDIREINYEAGRTPVWVKFDGDKFEMEDQRNFTDGSYKVYSTWVRSPEPQLVKEGEKFTQSISITPGKTSRPSQIGKNGRAAIEMDPTRVFELPKIGLGESSVVENLNQREVGLLKAMGLSHLRCDVDLSSESWRSHLEQLSIQAQQLGVGLEIAAFLDPKKGASELQLLREEVENLHSPLNSILVFNHGELATKADFVLKCERLFANYYSKPLIGGGTDRNFYDLAFTRPAYDSDSLVTYSVNPQVHAFDVTSLVETLEGQSWTAETAHKIYEKNPIAISPITLRPRFNPDEIVPDITEPGELPAPVDPRQLSLFAASWTAGSLKGFAESNVHSLTFYETVGWRGLVESEDTSYHSEKFLSRPGMAFPLYHVLADVCEMLPGSVLVTESTNPLAVNAISIIKGSSRRMLVYNLTWELQEVSIRKINASEARIRRLNEDSAEEAMFKPDNFRDKPGAAKRIKSSGNLELSLSPYEVVTVDYQDNDSY